MSDHEGVQWQTDGPLTEEGRQELLKHFGLESVAGELPLQSVSLMSPAVLIGLRRGLEARSTMLPRLNPVSHRMGGRIPAEQAA